MAAEILVVDDDAIAGGMATEVLTDAGYTTEYINESAQAIPAVRAQRPRLVILDILMPGVDGLTLCKLIKEDPEIKSTRVAIVSGKAMKAEQERAMRVGADLFIAKPYDIHDFAAAIKNLIGPPTAGSTPA